MNKFKILLAFTLILLFTSCTKNHISNYSPNKKNKIEIFVENNELKYKVNHNNIPIIESSSIKINLHDDVDFGSNLKIINHETNHHNEIWEPVWGTDKEIKNNYNETKIVLEEVSNTKRKFIIITRAYDDGVAFRYIIPNEKNKTLNIENENTEFNFAQNDTAWWIPHDEFAYESLYKKSLISEIKTAASPLTIRTNKNIWLCIHEAALLNYSEMYLKQTEANSAKFTTSLWQEPNGISAKIQGEFKSPWRSIHITESAEQLAESHLIQNLNEACKIENTTWIKPIKFIGIWWSLHTGKHTWYEGEKHGATTERTKKYIDFASENNIEAIIAEGWNKGWETWANEL
ncbi:MAG: glycoside hydrolase family 97 protein, partial [Bacteroidales bacterium]|nr:glycoside hydrolase family 97 protein [Bacteroidales bacterium]